MPQTQTTEERIGNILGHYGNALLDRTDGLLFGDDPIIDREELDRLLKQHVEQIQALVDEVRREKINEIDDYRIQLEAIIDGRAFDSQSGLIWKHRLAAIKEILDKYAKPNDR